MVDINLLREKQEEIKEGAKSKGVEVDVDKILQLDTDYRELSTQIQRMREERNRLSKAASDPAEREKVLDQARGLKADLEEKEKSLEEIKKSLDLFLLAIPNPPKPDVRVGKDESENEIIRKYKEPKDLGFKPRDHMELGQMLGILDIERAAKISGARFYYLKNEGVILEFALTRMVFDQLAKEGFNLIIPPVIINKEVMRALGYMENGGDEDMYHIEKDGMVLVGTSEQSIVPMYKDETLSEKQLPLRYAGFSACFRREAGSYGKDTKGIFRVHQFDKVEMVSFVKKGEDDAEHEFLLSIEENLLQMLELPYQVVKMCSGDLGFPAARKYDLEAWIPSQEKYRELTSASTTTDFQARRLNTKYKSGDKTEYVQILNGTGFAMARAIVTILENYQQEDGSVIIPEVLKAYTGFEKIEVK